jgi:hypothetical protein
MDGFLIGFSKKNEKEKIISVKNLNKEKEKI